MTKDEILAKLRADGVIISESEAKEFHGDFLQQFILVPRIANTSLQSFSCIYRLPLLREEECPSCYGRVKLKVFGCEKHGQCTIGKKLESMACCAECPDYKALVQ